MEETFTRVSEIYFTVDRLNSYTEFDYIGNSEADHYVNG